LGRPYSLPKTGKLDPESPSTHENIDPCDYGAAMPHPPPPFLD